MSDPLTLMLEDLREKYEQVPSSKAYERLYPGLEWGHLMAVIHKRLNEHFLEINGRAETTRHYWADPSRALLALIKEIEGDLHTLKRAGFKIELAESYEEALARCRPWLSPSGGSTVPEDFQPITLITHESAFVFPSATVTLAPTPARAAMKMVGGGSYANVYSYTDPNYGARFAIKRAKSNLDDTDLKRFRREFDILAKMSFPYIVEVYRYNEDHNEYSMEYCDTTLRSFISRNNDRLPFSTRKRIALQFLYGVNYIHAMGYLHRDLSLQNVLIKRYDKGAVMVKLSDFGLVKAGHPSDLTRTGTEMKGTIRDPSLADFKGYALPNEMYAIGWVLSYIFTGQDRLAPPQHPLGPTVSGCTHPAPDQRYKSVLELIAEVEQLRGNPAGTPA